MIRTLLASLLLASAGVAADADAEVKAFAGNWVIADAQLDGRDHTDDFQEMKLAIEGTRFTIKLEGNDDVGTFKLDPAKSPKWIDITTSPKGAFKGKTLPGIYKWDGDKLVLCLHADATARPTKFDAGPKTRAMLLTYTREKK
jgi:uncharacterized protein (TIGR03067 family)